MLNEKRIIGHQVNRQHKTRKREDVYMKIWIPENNIPTAQPILRKLVDDSDDYIHKFLTKNLMFSKNKNCI